MSVDTYSLVGTYLFPVLTLALGYKFRVASVWTAMAIGAAAALVWPLGLAVTFLVYRPRRDDSW